MVKRLMELWSDDKLSEFAIKFNSSIVAKTSENVNLVKMIDKYGYKVGYDFDWDYTLSRWVIYYLSSKYAAILNAGTANWKKELLANTGMEGASTSLTSYINFTRSKSKCKTILKVRLRCHFCNLKFLLEQERREHEEFWHHEKLMKR